MANRRLFYKRMIYRADFEALSDRARILYLYLNFEADDDGLVANPRQVISLANASRKHYRQLAEAGFVLEFPSGACAITHWHQHNITDRSGYIESKLWEERSQLEISPSGVYYKP